MTDIPNVHVAIASVAADIGSIAKDQQVTSGPAKYSFRGIDDVLDTIHGPLAKHGVSIVPCGFDILANDERVTKSGSAQVHLLAVVHYRIIGPAGDYVEAAALAEALDTSDKAASKAMSMGYKYVAFQVFSIPVRGALDESDRETLERGAVSNPYGDTQAHAVSLEELRTRIEDAADRLGMDVESATGKFRTANGGITVDQLWELPTDRLYGFARQLVSYAAQNAAGGTK
jgi:hypothetical protein